MTDTRGIGLLGAIYRNRLIDRMTDATRGVFWMLIALAMVFLFNTFNAKKVDFEDISFSIGAGELARFVQPSAASAILNRVTGGDPSSILGQLQSNGRVFLVNPSGIVFGPGAVIDAAGLVASTLNI